MIKIAEWKEVNIYQNDINNIITDAMLANSVIRINYRNSGWRNCLPYGWYVSKDGNVTVYVYKEDLSIRSYRLDRILGLYIDDKLDTEINKEEEITDEELNNKIEQLELIDLPENNDEIVEISESEQGASNPFDESLEILENDFEVPDEVQSDWRTLQKLQDQNNNDEESEENKDMLTNDQTANKKIKRFIRGDWYE